jgi:hypothetical protein
MEARSTAEPGVKAFTISQPLQVLLSEEMSKIVKRSIEIEKSMGENHALEYLQDRLLAWSQLIAVFPNGIVT